MTTSSGVTKTELTNEAIDKLMNEEGERDAVNGTQEPLTDAETGFVAGDEGDGETRIEAEPEARAKPIAMSPQDIKRQAMADRFKRPDAEDRPFDGDMTKAENLYGDVANETLEVDETLPEPGVPADQQRAAPAQDDRTHTIKVRGKEIKLTTAELLERASKVEAADTYLAESRDLLEQAKQVRGGRTAPDSQHPEDRTGAQDDEQDQDRRSDDTRRPGIDLKSVVEKIQFGDPEEAAADLARAIDSVTDQKVNEGHVARLVSNDLARAKMDLKAFRDANPELDKDELSSKAIENIIYSIYREEIVKLGVDEAQIPQDSKALADWHRLYRVHGHTVSKTADVLTQAKARFDKWRGPSTQAKPATTRKEAPRVAVNVDRTERRMAIPTQPSRGVAPRRDAAPVTQENSRKSAVQEMRRARGQPVVT
jgi:hypothetical protein